MEMSLPDCSVQWVSLEISASLIHDQSKTVCKIRFPLEHTESTDNG